MFTFANRVYVIMSYLQIKGMDRRTRWDSGRSTRWDSARPTRWDSGRAENRQAARVQPYNWQVKPQMISCIFELFFCLMIISYIIDLHNCTFRCASQLADIIGPIWRERLGKMGNSVTKVHLLKVMTKHTPEPIVKNDLFLLFLISISFLIFSLQSDWNRQKWAVLL